MEEDAAANCIAGVGPRGLGEGDDGDAESQDDEGDPALHAERAAEHSDGEDGGGEDLRAGWVSFARVMTFAGGRESLSLARAYLELVEHLEVDGVEITDGDILQGVLQRVEGGGDGELPAVAGEDLVVDLLEDDGGGGGGGQGAGDLGDGAGQADGQLDDLVEEDGGGSEVSVVAHGGHDAGVVHDLAEMRLAWCRVPVWRGIHTKINAEFWKVSYKTRPLSAPVTRRREKKRNGREVGAHRIGSHTVMRESCFMVMPKSVGPPAGGVVASRRAMAAVEGESGGDKTKYCQLASVDSKGGKIRLLAIYLEEKMCASRGAFPQIPGVEVSSGREFCLVGLVAFKGTWTGGRKGGAGCGSGSGSAR